MPELLRRLGAFRCHASDPCVTFLHRLRIGLAIAALILILSPHG